MNPLFKPSDDWNDGTLSVEAVFLVLHVICCPIINVIVPWMRTTLLKDNLYDIMKTSQGILILVETYNKFRLGTYNFSNLSESNWNLSICV